MAGVVAVLVTRRSATRWTVVVSEAESLAPLPSGSTPATVAVSVRTVPLGIEEAAS